MFIPDWGPIKLKAEVMHKLGSYKIGVLTDWGPITYKTTAVPALSHTLTAPDAYPLTRVGDSALLSTDLRS